LIMQRCDIGETVAAERERHARSSTILPESRCANGFRHGNTLQTIPGDRLVAVAVWSSTTPARAKLPDPGASADNSG
jgi:hypothetical protein